MNYKQIVQIILNITLVSTIIGVLFFTYGKTIEKKIVEEQSAYIAKTIATDIKIFLPLELRQNIAAQLQVPDMREADARVEVANAALQDQAVVVLGILFIVGIIVTLIICKIGNVNKTHVAIEAAVILVFVVATEVLFLNIIARNYKSADPNFVKCELLRSVKHEFPPM